MNIVRRAWLLFFLFSASAGCARCVELERPQPIPRVDEQTEGELGALAFFYLCWPWGLHTHRCHVDLGVPPMDTELWGELGAPYLFVHVVSVADEYVEAGYRFESENEEVFTIEGVGCNRHFACAPEYCCAGECPDMGDCPDIDEFPDTAVTRYSLAILPHEPSGEGRLLVYDRSDTLVDVVTVVVAAREEESVP
jgi:hypothetical protein